jgi:Xaa-Pro aminopeptidase
MKYHQIDRDLFIKNRSKFMAQMKPKVLPFLTQMIFTPLVPIAQCLSHSTEIFFI